MTSRFFATIALLIILFFPFQPSMAAMDYAKQVLIEKDFSNRDLRGVTFNLANLRMSNFSGSDLEGASLFGAKLDDTDLSNTNLRGSTLDSAVFNGTNLQNSNLEDSFAFNTKFDNVNIDGADFTNVLLRGDAIKSLCEVARGSNPVTGRITSETLEC